MMIIGFVLIIGALLVWLFTPGPVSAPQTPTAASQINTSSDVPRVSITDAFAAHQSGEAVFLDVRGDVFYNEGHIPGALSIPYDEIESRYEELDPSDWIITYCT